MDTKADEVFAHHNRSPEEFESQSMSEASMINVVVNWSARLSK